MWEGCYTAYASVQHLSSPKLRRVRELLTSRTCSRLALGAVQHHGEAAGLKRWQKKLGVQKQVLAAKEDGAQSLLSSLLMKDAKFPDKINTMKSEIDESKKDLEQTRRDLAQSVPIGKLLDAHSDTHSAQVQAETSAIALEAGRKGASQRPSRSPERGKRCP